MAVKVIVGLKAAAGRRDELRSRIEELAARPRPAIGGCWDASVRRP